MAARWIVVRIYRYLWGKTGQSAAFGTVGYYGFTTSEGNRNGSVQAIQSVEFGRVD